MQHSRKTNRTHNTDSANEKDIININLGALESLVRRSVRRRLDYFIPMNSDLIDSPVKLCGSHSVVHSPSHLSDQQQACGDYNLPSVQHHPKCRRALDFSSPNLCDSVYMPSTSYNRSPQMNSWGSMRHSPYDYQSQSNPAHFPVNRHHYRRQYRHARCIDASLSPPRDLITPHREVPCTPPNSPNVETYANDYDVPSNIPYSDTLDYDITPSSPASSCHSNNSDFSLDHPRYNQVTSGNGYSNNNAEDLVDINQVCGSEYKSPQMPTCVCCLKQPVNQVIIPCGHALYCDACLIEFDDGKCPTCRAVTFTTTKLYLSWITINK